MKKTPTFLLIAAGLLLSACTTPPDQTAPTLSLTATPDVLTGAGTITLTATATDNVGVTKVSFYQGTTLLSEDTTAPYEAKDAVAAQEATSQRTYRAVAVDAAGNSTEQSAQVTVEPMPAAALPVLKTTLRSGTPIEFYAEKFDYTTNTSTHMLLTAGRVDVNQRVILNPIAPEVLDQAGMSIPPTAQECQGQFVNSDPALKYVETYFYARDSSTTSGIIRLFLSNPDGSVPQAHTAYPGGFPNVLWHADRTATVKGTITCVWPSGTYVNTVDLDLKKGWNFVQRNYVYDSTTNVTQYSTKTLKATEVTLFPR